MNKNLLQLKKYIYRYSSGLKNQMKYGKNAPEFGELIYINPSKHDSYLKFEGPFKDYRRRAFSGKIISGNWDLQPRLNIETLPRYRACYSRWVQNIPWEKTGIFDYMLNEIEEKGSVDGCFTIDDLIKRYENLDKLFEEVKITRSFKTQQELNPKNFNESGGILFHIDRNNIPIWGAGGVHRFSMARILGLDYIPAQLGIVHPKAIEIWRKHKKW